MADNINLIPAAELPLTEAEEVDVLCVENGELKRKAGANLGGGGGYVIHVPAGEISTDDGGNLNITLSESYDNFMPIIEAGGSVWLDLSKDPTLAEVGALYVTVPVIGAFLASGEGLMLLASNAIFGQMIQVSCPNGTWTPETAASTEEA